MLPAIDIGFTEVPLYGPIFMIGAVIAIIIIRLLAPSARVDKYDSFYAVIYGMVGLLIGAKALYFITKLPNIIVHFDKYIEYLGEDFMAALNYAFGGLVFYGGLIGFALGVWRYCRHFKVNLWGIADLYFRSFTASAGSVVSLRDAATVSSITDRLVYISRIMSILPLCRKYRVSRYSFLKRDSTLSALPSFLSFSERKQREKKRTGVLSRDSFSESTLPITLLHVLCLNSCAETIPTAE